MWYKSILAQLALLLVSGVVFAQSTPFYEDMYLDSKPGVVDKKGSYEAYDLGKFVFYNGTRKYAKSFYIEDANTGNKIFNFEDVERKASRFDPKFFKANNELPIVIMVDIETAYSWGQHIFILEGDQVSYSGFLPYGADNFNFSNLALYAHFDYRGDHFILSFREDTQFIDYVSDDIFEGGDLKFKVERNKITRIPQSGSDKNH